MKQNYFLTHFKIDGLSATPKYQQIVNAVLASIRQQKLKKGDVLPSINEVSFEFDISRLTVEKGYNQLRKRGIIESFPGKGYFVANTFFEQDLRIFLLFNKLSAHKKIIYDAFVETLGDKAAIDFYVYNNDFNLFQKLLNQQKSGYSHYVIIPHFVEQEQNAYRLINALPKEKLIVIDKIVKEITGSYGAVYQFFESDIFNALTAALAPLSKYHTLKLIFPENSYAPKEIIAGFVRFCQNYAFQHQIVHHLDQEPVNEGEVFINLMEEDLVIILEKIIALNLSLGQQVGLISYNETPFKKFIMNGLTTISTDFAAMGRTAAQLVLNPSEAQVENPFYLTLRGSL